MIFFSCLLVSPLWSFSIDHFIVFICASPKLIFQLFMFDCKSLSDFFSLSLAPAIRSISGPPGPDRPGVFTVRCCLPAFFACLYVHICLATNCCCFVACVIDTFFVLFLCLLLALYIYSISCCIHICMSINPRKLVPHENKKKICVCPLCMLSACPCFRTSVFVEIQFCELFSSLNGRPTRTTRYQTSIRHHRRIYVQ